MNTYQMMSVHQILTYHLFKQRISFQREQWIGEGFRNQESLLSLLFRKNSQPLKKCKKNLSGNSFRG